MRNLKIGMRLALGFGIVIVLLVLMSGIGLWRIIDGNLINGELQDRQAVNALILQWARQTEVNSNLTLASANLNDPEAQNVARQGLKISDARILELRAQLAKRIEHPQAVALFQQALAAQDDFFKRRNAAFIYLEKWDIGKANAFFSKAMPSVVRAVVTPIDQLSDFQNRYTQDLYTSASAANRLGMLILAVATLLALVVSPLFSWRVTRSITGPLREAVGLAQRVARRDLASDVAVRGRDEVAALQRALAEMVSNLRQAVGEVRTGADSIAAAAAQITTGNLDLSSRTEQQASSLAQTAATMEELTTTMRQNADHIQQSGTLAASASQVARDGGAAVLQVVRTMGDIHSTSRRVADISGVIDGIAFQTNILALNAAVEAARAGEQGRGFAVVASEVRALAQRSATAAKEIKTLIDAAVAAVATGNAQAESAGRTMENVVAGIGRVTGIMGEIAAANREQTTGIEEVNTAVTQMDDVTRRNAGLVEQSAAAAGSLHDQAESLARLVATFRLGIEAKPGDDQAGDRQPDALPLRGGAPLLAVEAA